MTQALFPAVSEYEEECREQKKRRLNVSGVLKILGVSRSGYLRSKKKVPSDRELRKCAIKERILEIHHDSHQNYGAPKITECLRKEGEVISEKTVGNYMNEMGIKAQYIKPYTVTTIDSDFSRRISKPQTFFPIYMDIRRFCISDQYHGFIFTKNHILGT